MVVRTLLGWSCQKTFCYRMVILDKLLSIGSVMELTALWQDLYLIFSGEIKYGAQYYQLGLLTTTQARYKICRKSYKGSLP